MPEYITSRKNDKVLHMKRLGADKGYRHRCCEFLCDGDKLLNEAIDNGAQITMVLSCTQDLPPLPNSVQTIMVPRSILEMVSPMKNPQDVLFSCAMPDHLPMIRPNGTYIILENVQDPGNVGTVIRSAGAFGIDAVLLTGGCADLYNPKTIRATMGAIFRKEVLETDFEGLRQLQADGIRIYGAVLHQESQDVRRLDWHNTAIAVGSEGRGLSPQLVDLCDGYVSIPMCPACESLNAAVAASIFMWEMSRSAL
jgi:TrmH family RNA methyltransferase